MKTKCLFCLIISLILCNPLLKGQSLEPLSWDLSFSKKAVALDEEVYLLFKVKINDSWYLYSNDFEAGGPLVSRFSFEEKNDFQLIGKVEALGSEKKYDEVFEQEVSIFKKEAVFRQKVKLLKKDFTIDVDFRGQICSEVDGRCVLIQEHFLLDSSEIQIK